MNSLQISCLLVILGRSNLARDMMELYAEQENILIILISEPNIAKS